VSSSGVPIAQQRIGMGAQSRSAFEIKSTGHNKTPKSNVNAVFARRRFSMCSCQLADALKNAVSTTSTSKLAATRGKVTGAESI